MAHLRRLTTWSLTKNMFSGVFVLPPWKCSLSDRSYSCVYRRTLETVRCKASSTFVTEECHQFIKLCAFNNSVRQFCLTSSVYKKKKKLKEKNTPPPVSDEDSVDDSVLEDPYFESLRGDSRILGIIGSDSRPSDRVGVLVLQPWVKWGPRKRIDTSGQLLLDEAVALVSTLPDVQVVAKEVVPVKSMAGKTIFGSGTLERLSSQVRSSCAISCVFISVDMLKKIQINDLEEVFGRKVLDRYSVVLGIFRHHAQTKEAKLQVALAELPYIRKRVSGDKEHLMIMEREKRLKAALDKLAGVRSLIRKSRVKNNIPTVAVVGYTNSGKTTLIHAITKDVRAEGKDQLFATLDVTAHGGRLPCGLEVLFIDTVGFIQNIPTDLVASFKATLEDAIYSDVVIHVRDASHPEYELQGNTVSKTLAALPLPKETPIITVANKMDLEVTVPEDNFQGAHQVSAVMGQGIEDLLYDVEREVLRTTGRKVWKFSLPTGSHEIQWLRSVTGIAQEEMDENNPQITHILAVMTDQEVAVFNRNFGK